MKTVSVALRIFCPSLHVCLGEDADGGVVEDEGTESGTIS